MNKLTVFGMTKKCYSVLSSLLPKYSYLVDAVVVSKDNNVVNDYYYDIVELCNKFNVNVYDRQNFTKINTEYTIAISWRWIIQDDSTRLIIFHDSILPKYRGFNPLVTCLLNGDTEIGVTALYASDEYDKGPIIRQSTSKISYPITIADAIEIVNANYVDLAMYIVSSIERGTEPTSTPQKECDATYSLWRDEEDYFIDWSEPASDIKRFVEAVGFPYKGAAAIMGKELVRILDVTVVEDVIILNRTVGKVIFIEDSKPVVVCGSGLLRINMLHDDYGNSLLPLHRFRVRFKGYSDTLTCT